MRTVILTSGILISDAIRNQPDLGAFYSTGAVSVIGLLILLSIIIDAYDLLKRTTP